MKFLKYLLIFVVRMCLDITKYIDIVSTKELDNIDNITRIINSYDINELIRNFSVMMTRLILHMRNVKQIVLMRLIQCFMHSSIMNI